MSSSTEERQSRGPHARRSRDPLGRGAADRWHLLVGSRDLRRVRRASRGHPATTDRFRAFLAKVSLPELAVEFVIVVAAVAGVLAAAYEATESAGSSQSFVGWWEELFLYLLSFPTDAALSADVKAGRGVFQAMSAVAGLLLPALFVGAIVLKLFISPDLFVMRSRVNLMTNTPGDPRFTPGGRHISVRGYSGTTFRLLDVTFSAVLRLERIDADGNTILLHRPLDVANPNYAIAHPHVPYTLAIPLAESDFGEDGGSLRKIQGHELRGNDVLIVLIEGRIPELSSDFMESHDFPLPESVVFAPYAGLAVDYSRPASQWEGWERFDE